MARRKLRPGEAGDFSEPKWNDERGVWQINCLVGEHIGRPSRIHASSPIKRKARDNLKLRVAEWKPRAAALGTYSSECTVAEAAEAWLVKCERERKQRNQTTAAYRKEIHRSTGPNANKGKFVITESDLGRMKATDVLPFHVRLHLATLNGFTTKQSLHKVVLSHAFQLLVDDGILVHNPVSSIKGYTGENAPRRPRRPTETSNPYFPEEPCPFTIDEMARYRKMEARYFSPENCQRYKRDPRFLDYTMLCYDLAARPSEVLALWWNDVDLATGEVLIDATVVKAKIKVWQIRRAIEEFGLTENDIVTRGTSPGMKDDDLVTVTYRQPFGKTRESKGRLIVSDATLAMLRCRNITMEPGQKLVFPSQRGTLMGSSQMSGPWHCVVKGTELEWSTLQTLRSTRATRVAEKHGLAAARLMLRHQENSRVTISSYVRHDKPAVNFSDVM